MVVVLCFQYFTAITATVESFNYALSQHLSDLDYKVNSQQQTNNHFLKTNSIWFIQLFSSV
jgi:hypothetical protein